MSEDFYRDIGDDVERWFDTSSYDENDKRRLPMGKNKNVYGFFKDESGGKIMKKFVTLRAKTYAYLTDDDEKKKAKGTKKRVIKRELMFENYKDCLFNGEVILRSQRFKSDHHKVYTEEVNKITLSSDDYTRLQTFVRATTYPQGTHAFKLCKNESLDICKAKQKLLIKDCENEFYMACNIFLNYMKTKCSREIKKYVEINLKSM